MFRFALSLYFCFSSVLCLGFQNETNSSTLPNFIIMLMDDMGWGDLGVFGEPNRETPNLDEMAAEGALLTDFYTANPLCSPSRAALLTGRLPIRNGFYTDNAHARNGYTETDVIGGISNEEILIPQLLAEKGYRNHIIGKWHLGHEDQYLPLKHGFHEFFGSPDIHTGPYDNKNTPNIPVFRNDKMVGRYYEKEFDITPDGRGNMTLMFIEDALRFIKEQASNGTPFFLYWTPDASHAPTYASDKFFGKSRRGRYGDAVAELDYGVGMILKTLKDVEIDRNTLVVFTSDNGPALVSKTQGGSNGPFLCGKQTTFEGGFREPTIAWWPGRIKPGMINHQVSNVMDLFTTALELAGVSVPDDRVIDGVSLIDTLTTGKQTDRPIFYYRGNQLMAVRYGLYKAHFWTWSGPQSEYDQGIDFCPGQVIAGITDHVQRNYSSNPILYHLGSDPSERYPISSKTKEYSAAMKVIRKETEKHYDNLIPGKPVLNWCDNAAMPWAPPGCEELKRCLNPPPSKLHLCQWLH